MREIELWARCKVLSEHVALVDDEDYEKVHKHRWRLEPRSNNTLFYAACHTALVNSFYMHRLILDARHEEIVDHRDDNGLNNTRENIRVTSLSVNAIRMRRKSNNTTGYRGVHKAHGKYEAKIRCNFKRRYLGLFNTAEEAAAAYHEAAVELFGEDAPSSKLES